MPMQDSEEKINPLSYDPTVGEEGWAALGRESIFTRMVLENRWNRKRFKETRKMATFDKARQHYVNEDKLAEYERLSLMDKATGIYNAHSFRKRLIYELKRAKRYKRALSLLVVSIDRMEEMKKTFGLMVQDEVMAAAAGIVKQAIRDVDIAARSAPDQIAVIFPETYSTRSMVVAERIRERLMSTPIADRRGLVVHGSIGVATFPTHCREAADMLETVNRFIKKARDNGGNQVVNND